jgi:hypothetical protein
MPNSETEIMDVTLTLKELGNGNQGLEKNYQYWVIIHF